MTIGMTIRDLDVWCDRQVDTWSASRVAGREPVMLLHSSSRGRSLYDLRLVVSGGEFRLENEAGEVLASASDLPALLDAVDGGVGEPTALPSRRAAAGSDHRVTRPLATVF